MNYYILINIVAVELLDGKWQCVSICQLSRLSTDSQLILNLQHKQHNIMKTFIFVACLLACTSVSALKRYNGYKVFSVKKAENKDQINVLLDLQKQRPDLDFWNDPSLARKTDIMVPPHEIHDVEEYLKSNGFQYNVAIGDVQRVVEREVLRSGRQSVMNWKSYHRLNTIYAWLDSLTNQYPQIVKVSSLGKSSEKRDIKLVKISTGGYTRKPVIYIDAGIHAREWIAPATATFIMKELLAVPLEEREILTNIDWFFVPVLNVDGYEYTHTEDRLWRKTRSKLNGEDCIGVDANRNFDFHWGEEGVKSDPCANTYPGPYPFSEPEANATANFLYEHRGKVKAYITLHSYSQLWLTPYGYSDDLPDDYDDLKELGDNAVRALEEVHGTEFQVGAPSQILYKNSGSSRDWAKGVAEIKYPFTIELPDKGETGFLLPANEIKPTAEETWAGIKVVAKHLLQEYPFKK